MNKKLLTILVLLVVAGTTLASDPLDRPSALAVAGDERPEDRDAIRAHIDTIFKAYMHKDRETVRATHADAWRGFLTGSRSIIRGIDEYMEAAERSLGGAGRIFSYAMKEFDVLFYGDVALVPYVAEMAVGIADVRAKRTLRVLDVYTRIDGHWIQIASNTTLHPDSAAAFRQQPNPLLPLERERLLAEREALWRAWFDNDRERLAAVLPEETLAISAVAEDWTNRDAELAASKQFHDSGARLVRLEFPRTEIRMYGDVAVLYTSYELETEDAEGERRIQSGRGTEVFVKRAGRWVNPGWHLDAGLPAGR